MEKWVQQDLMSNFGYSIHEKNQQYTYNIQYLARTSSIFFGHLSYLFCATIYVIPGSYGPELSPGSFWQARWIAEISLFKTIWNCPSLTPSLNMNKFEMLNIFPPKIIKTLQLHNNSDSKVFLQQNIFLPQKKSE